MLILLVVAVGAAAGGAFALMSGTDEPTSAASANANNQLQTQSTGGGDATPIPGADTTQPSGRFGQGGGQGTNVEPITGTVASLTSTKIVVTSNGADIDIEVPADVRVQLRTVIASATGDLLPGTEITALLQRTADGAITATNIIVGGGGGGFGGGIGGRGSGGGTTGGTTPETSGFNAVQGTVVSLQNNELVMDTADGPVSVTVTDSTPVQLNLTFAQAANNLPVGSNVTIIGQRSDDGTFTPMSISNTALVLGPDGTPVQGQGGFGGGGFFGDGGFAPPGGFVPPDGFIPPDRLLQGGGAFPAP